MYLVLEQVTTFFNSLGVRQLVGKAPGSLKMHIQFNIVDEKIKRVSIIRPAYLYERVFNLYVIYGQTYQKDKDIKQS